jgi:hypothetical protein
MEREKDVEDSKEGGMDVEMRVLELRSKLLNFLMLGSSTCPSTTNNETW